MINNLTPQDVMARVVEAANIFADKLQAQYPGYNIKLKPLVSRSGTVMSDQYVAALSNAIGMVLNLSADEWKGKSRRKDYILARQIFVLLLRDNYPYITFEGIGKILCGKDHATVLWTYKQAKNYIESCDKVFVKHYQAVCDMLNTQFNTTADATAKV